MIKAIINQLRIYKNIVDTGCNSVKKSHFKNLKVLALQCYGTFFLIKNKVESESPERTIWYGRAHSVFYPHTSQSAGRRTKFATAKAMRPGPPIAVTH